MSKEKFYDEKVAPLMKEIIAICKEHKIAMVASFAIPNDEDPELLCTTALLAKRFEPVPEEFIKFYDSIYSNRGTFVAITVTKE